MSSLSIIIPVYNVEKYLKQCLDSIFVDNSFTGQVICVNDGSTDGSLMILEEYAAKYANIEIISQPNAGLSAARNTGLRVAQGEYVLFLDSDDWIFPNTLQKIIDRVDGEDVLYFNAKKYYEDTQTYDKDCAIEEMKHVDGQSYFEAVYNKQRNMPFVCVVGGIYNRQFLIDNNLWNAPGIYHEDALFTPQVLLVANHVSSINEYVYAYRMRKGAITSTISKKHIRDAYFVIQSLYHRYINMKESLSVCFWENLADNYIDLMREAYENRLSLFTLWSWRDSLVFFKSTNNSHKKHVAKLSFISPKLAYLYYTNQLTDWLRRVINRFM